MCGIIGYYGSGVKLDIDLSIDMLSHRGPDSSGTFFDDKHGVALGHTRLSILDLTPAGAQPMISDDGNTIIVFNGEIYNFRELRSELEHRGVIFKGHSDTEVLLNYFVLDGHSILHKLNGIFAFAIYDRRTGELVVARDALGVKPLYYASIHGSLTFASELKAISTVLDNKANYDYGAIYRYATYLWCPGNGTPNKSIRKLEPGEYLRVRDGKIIDKKRWFKPPMFRSTLVADTEPQIISTIASKLRAAVYRQMVADVPVGAFLSGGLDSSSVVAFARELDSSIQCFSISTTGVTDSGFVDDLPYAKRVAKHLDVKLDVIEVDSAKMASAVENMVWQLDEPLADPAPLNVLFISQLARESGIKVLLSGAGGDDLFTGYRRHLAINHANWWQWLPTSVRSQLAIRSQHLDQRSGFGRRLAKLFRGSELEGDAYIANYFTWTDPELLLQLFTNEARRELSGVRADQPLIDFLVEMPDSRPALDRMLALEQRFFLADHNLLYTDKMSMAVGVEVRVPFLDLELVEYAASIPSIMKQRGREGKWVLKKAMEPYLPHDIIYRPKTGFGAPLRNWLKSELKPMMHNVLSEESLNRRGIFDPIAVHTLIKENEEGKRDASYTIFSLMCIELWCRRFVDHSNKVEFSINSIGQ